MQGMGPRQAASASGAVIVTADSVFKKQYGKRRAAGISDTCISGCSVRLVWRNYVSSRSDSLHWQMGAAVAGRQAQPSLDRRETAGAAGLLSRRCAG